MTGVHGVCMGCAWGVHGVCMRAFLVVYSPQARHTGAAHRRQQRRRQLGTAPLKLPQLPHTRGVGYSVPNGQRRENGDCPEYPEVATVGLTEAEAAEQRIEAKAFTFPIQVLGKAQTAGEKGGFVKLVGDAKTGQLLGAQIVCSRAGGLIAEAALGVQLEATLEEIAHTIHTHPTLAEGIMQAAEGWHGQGIDYNT